MWTERVIKPLPFNSEDWSLDLLHLHKSWVVVAACLMPALETQRQSTPKANWLYRLAVLLSSGLGKRQCLNEGKVTEEDTWALCPGLHTYILTCIHHTHIYNTNTHACTHACVHTPPHTQWVKLFTVNTHSELSYLQFMSRIHDAFFCAINHGKA